MDFVFNLNLLELDYVSRVSMLIIVTV